MSTPPAIRVDDDLASSQAGVAVRATNHKPSRGVQVVDGLVVQVLGRHHRLDHMLEQVLADLLQRHLLRVLRRDDDRVDPLGHRLPALHLVLRERRGGREGGREGGK